MKYVILGMMFLATFGVMFLTTQSFGNSLSTSSEINKIGILNMSDLTLKTLVGLDLGVTDAITAVTLTFKNPIDNNSDLDISLRDSNNIEIGSGTTTVSPASAVVTITLSNSITAIERDTLESAIISVS